MLGRIQTGFQEVIAFEWGFEGVGVRMQKGQHCTCRSREDMVCAVPPAQQAKAM